MRSHLMGISAGTRPRMESSSRVSGLALAGFGLPAGVFGAAHVLALRLAKGETFACGKRGGHRLDGYCA